jgi:tetratricopeptide (TPR) repeat protein
MKARITIFIIFFLISLPLWAQTTEVEGTVKDDQGNPMPEVKVYFEHADIAGIKAHVTSNKRGEFYYPGLLYQEPGTWKIYPKLEGHLIKHLKVESRDSRKELFTDIDSDLNMRQNYPEILCKPGGKVLVDFILVPSSYFEAPAEEEEGLELIEAEAPSISSIQKARKLYDEGRIEDALLEYEKSIEEKKDASICVEMSKILFESEREGEAVIALRKALSLKPDLPMVHYGLAHILRKKGDHAAALEELKQERNISPDNEKVLKSMGEILVELGKDKEAINIYHQLIEKNPNSSDAYIALANIYSRLGDFEKSEQAYRKVTELNPENADRIYYNVGVSIINKENLTAADRKKAGESFRKALELNPDYAAAHLQLGYLLLGDGKMPAAKEHFKKYLELKPDSSEAETVKAIIESI